MTGGVSLEPRQYTSLGDRVESKVFTGFIGWPDKEEHLTFRTTEKSEKMAGLPTGEALGKEVYHVEFARHA
jgi:hypothetical protein